MKKQLKQLTIDKLIPKWSHYFDLLANKEIDKAEKYRRRVDITITDTDRCSVGEAWKWSNEYSVTEEAEIGIKFKCGTCSKFSFGKETPFAKSVEHSFIHLNSKLHNKKTRKGYNWRNYPTVKAFVKHWSEAHLK